MPQIMQSHLLMVAKEPLVALSVGDRGGQDMDLNVGGPAKRCLVGTLPGTDLLCTY